ncbi:hypothetical protein B0H11DRAFT_2060406 [Mycena galericulata]|nr:hypothetical protein B0H11DRAFT_2060406 [Mycena galericulata]
MSTRYVSASPVCCTCQSHQDRAPGSKVTPADRAGIRFYLASNANYATIQEDFKVSADTIRKVKRNGYKDNIHEDYRYLGFKQEDGGVLLAPGENEVVEISSDSEDSGSEYRRESPNEVPGERKSRRLRFIEAPTTRALSDPEVLLRQPQTPHSESNKSTEPQKASKRVRFQDDESSKTAPKRQKTSQVEEYKACIDCERFYRICDGPDSSSHRCSRSGLLCTPAADPEARHGVKSRVPSGVVVVPRPISSNLMNNGHAFQFRRLPLGPSRDSRNTVGATYSGVHRERSRVAQPSGGAGPSGTKAAASGVSVDLNPASTTLQLPKAPVAGPSGTKTSSGVASVNVNLERLSLDPTTPAPLTQASEEPKVKEVVKTPGSDIPQANRTVDNMDQLLAKLGLPHCADVLHKAGFRSLADLDVLRRHLAKDKTREEVRSILMPQGEGGGLVLRDWLTLSDYFVPTYGS